MKHLLLVKKCSHENYRKLMQLNNTKLHNFITKYIEICNPDSVYICDDSEKDRQYIRNRALENGEEILTIAVKTEVKEVELCQ